VTTVTIARRPHARTRFAHLGLAGVRIAGALALAALLAPPLRAADSALPGRASAARKTSLRLSVDVPGPNSTVGNEGGLLFLAGEALAHYGEFRAQDLVFVIDTSESVGQPSGIDANGDGRISRGEPLDPGMLDAVLGRDAPRDMSDSILAAEVAAVRGVLERLDARTTRVGVVTFSGEPGTPPPHATTRVELTSNFDDVRDGLLAALGIGPRGHTNILAGVQVAMAELTAAPGSLSAPRAGVDKRMMLLTDGISTLPLGGAIRHNRDLVIREGRAVARAKIRIDTFAIGTAQYDPITANGLARQTGGSSAALANVADLAERLPKMEFGELAELRVTNLTRAQPAAHLNHGSNGRFSALVQLAEGQNVLEVYARTTDGTEATRQVSVQFAKSGVVQQLPAEQDAERTRMMAKWLNELKKRSDALQAERDAQVLRALQQQIAAERERQRMQRRLEIETERSAPTPK
jgi:hypothetical protein